MRKTLYSLKPTPVKLPLMHLTSNSATLASHLRLSFILSLIICSAASSLSAIREPTRCLIGLIRPASPKLGYLLMSPPAPVQPSLQPLAHHRPSMYTMVYQAPYAAPLNPCVIAGSRRLHNGLSSSHERQKIP